MSYSIENIGQYTVVIDIGGAEPANPIPVYEELTLLTEGKVRDGVLSLRRNDSINSRRLRSDVSNYRTFPSKDMVDGSLVAYSETQLITWVRENTGVNTLYAHTHTASEITDFDTEVANNPAVVLNTAKLTNVPTALSTGTVTATTYGITSDGGVDDIVLPEADTTNAGLLGSDKWDEIVANTLKVTNATHTGEVTGATALTIASNIIDEDNLKLDEAPTDNFVLTADSAKTGGMKWLKPTGEYTIKTGTYTALVTDDIIECTGTFTITLYTAVGNTNKKITIKNAGTGVITEDGDGTETLEGELTQILPMGDSHTWASNGTNWLII